MAVDLKALQRASEGDPKATVAVSKAWLAEVHKLLSEAERAKVAKRVGDTLTDLAGKVFGAR